MPARGDWALGGRALRSFCNLLSPCTQRANLRKTAAVTAESGIGCIMPGFEFAPGHDSGSGLHEVDGPVIHGFEGFLLLDTGALGGGAQLRQHGAARLRVGGYARSLESSCQDCSLVRPELRVPAELGFPRLPLARLEVNDHEPSVGVDLQPVHLAAQDGGPSVLF